MNHLETIFQQVKALLKAQLGDVLEEREGGSHLVLPEHGLWVALEFGELKFGLGLVSDQYNPEHDDQEKALDRLFRFLGKRMRITEYLKGRNVTKVKIEIESSDEQWEYFGEAITWLNPFWKDSTERVFIQKNAIDLSKVGEDVERIQRIGFSSA